METRVRLSGPNKGNKYKCFKSPSGVAYWSLKKANEAGFPGFFTSPAGSKPGPKLKKKKSKLLMKKKRKSLSALC